MRIYYANAAPTIITGIGRTAPYAGESFIDHDENDPTLIGAIDLNEAHQYEISGGTVVLKSVADITVSELVKSKANALNIVRVATGEQITVTGDWSIERQTNCIDGVYPNVVRPSDSKTFVFAAECKKYRVSIIQQGNAYEDVVSAALTVADVTAAVAAIAFDTSLILSYSEVKGQVNG